MNLADYPHVDLTRAIIGAAMNVHRALGPGLLESAYQICLAEEFTYQGIRFDEQVALPVTYRGKTLECGYRLDFVVQDAVIAEIKCVDKLLPIHQAQLLTYLRLARKPVGLLINFNVDVLRRGIVRTVLTEHDGASATSAPLR